MHTHTPHTDTYVRVFNLHECVKTCAAAVCNNADCTIFDSSIQIIQSYLLSVLVVVVVVAIALLAS